MGKEGGYELRMIGWERFVFSLPILYATADAFTRPLSSMSFPRTLAFGPVAPDHHHLPERYDSSGVLLFLDLFTRPRSPIVVANTVHIVDHMIDNTL